MTSRKKGARCVACGGTGKISQNDSRVPLRRMSFSIGGLVRCNRCGGTGREK